MKDQRLKRVKGKGQGVKNESTPKDVNLEAVVPNWFRDLLFLLDLEMLKEIQHDNFALIGVDSRLKIKD